MSSLPRRLRSLMSAKLGRCPRCIRSSILGTIIAWPVFVSVWLVDPPGRYGLLAILALVIALAFTLLMLAHLGVFTRRILQGMPGANALGRRQFLSNAMGLGVAVFASALFGPSCRRPSATEAEASLDVTGTDDGAATSHTGQEECPTCLDRCVRRFGECYESAEGSGEQDECVRVFARCEALCRRAGGPCFVPAPAPNPRCGPLSDNVCDPVKANVTAARCQTLCNPGTPACMKLARRPCEGRLRGPVFTRVVGGQTRFCQWCACVCGTFVPGG